MIVCPFYRPKMTYYDELIVSSVNGLVPQLVFCCICQEITNRRYIAESLEVDYASDSINLGIQLTNDPLTIATLQLDISFPIAQQSPLLNRSELAERVSSVTDLHTDNIAIAREASYPRGGDYPVPDKPTYLSGRNDTLERRIVWLCQQIINLDSWLAEWNQLVVICDFVTTNYNIYNNASVAENAGFIVRALRTLAMPFMLLEDTIALDDESAITAYTDHLISQLDTFPPYREVPYVPDYKLLINIPVITLITEQGDIYNVESESSFVDSFIEQNSSPSELEYGDYINDGSSGSGSGTPANAPNQDPQNSLPDC